MTDVSNESVCEQLAALHAHRVATIRPEDLQVNINQRAALVAGADRSGFVRSGTVLEDFTLPEVDGATVSLHDLLKTGPGVLLFFRFAGCPACNIAMPIYGRQLYPKLHSLGAALVAISPQISERLVEIKRKHQLEFPVASDTNNELARKFGILFTYDEPSKRAALAAGKPIGEVTGTGTWELPMPTVIVVDRNRVVRFVDVCPDWLLRTEADVIVAAVRALVHPKKALR